MALTLDLDLQTWFKGTANPLPNALCGQKYASNKRSRMDRRSDEHTDRYVYSQESPIPLKEQGDGQKV